MKNIFAAVLLGALVTMAGCGQGTSGGPGATSPPTKAPMTGQVDDTFSLIMPSATLNQGGNTTVSIGIKRGQNFSEDVSLGLAGLPAGVTLDPANPLIKHGDNAAQITLKAAPDAALGDFTVKVTGHPSKGADAVAEMKVSIAKQEPAEAATEAGDVAKAKWDEYNAAVQTQWAQFNAKFEELKDRAAKATGQAKTDLDAKVAEAKVKLDEAAVKLDELKSASADRWEKVKEGVANAFEDLKKIFE
jgi:hypothetical protein